MEGVKVVQGGAVGVDEGGRGFGVVEEPGQGGGGGQGGGWVEAEQGVEGVGGELESGTRVAGDEVSQPGCELRGDGKPRLERRKRAVEVFHGDVEQAVSFVRACAADELEGHASEGVEVGPGAEFAPAGVELFGGHVVGGAGPGAGGDVVGGDAGFGLGKDDAEVGEFEFVVADEDVFGLEVAVDDIMGVGEGEGVQDFLEDELGLGPGMGEVFAQGALSDLHDEVGQTVSGFGWGRVAFGDVAVVVDGGDVGVDECGVLTCFVKKRGEQAVVEGALGEDDFDGGGSAVVDVLGSPDLGHSSAS